MIKQRQANVKGNHRWSKVGKTVGAFALGATAGSVVALLFAPASGRVTRRHIGGQLRSWERSAQHRFQMTRKLLSQKAEGIKEVALNKLVNTRDWLVQKVATNGKHRPVHRRVLHRA